MSTFSRQTTDGGVLAFDRESGLNILTRSAGTSGLKRQAPRVLQVGLLTPCNLKCHFCYRDAAAPSLLTAEFLVELLGRCADWGVLEVAFGGGEPLLFRGFVKLLLKLTRTTTLGLNFTTNGTLLTDQVLDTLRDWSGEIRVSAYEENRYREVLRRLQRRPERKFGVNWLVTPRNISQLEVMVRDCLELGAQNVMLLGYKGQDPTLHLTADQLRQLAGRVERLQHLPLRLDICWHPYLRSVPQLFERSDCGAGDEFLVITPDRAVQPCSFHQERVPFETFEDLKRIYLEMRVRKPEARIQGCTRARFQPAAALVDGVYLWQAYASNNSGDATIVGRFRTSGEAERAAAAVRELASAHEHFLASPENAEWDEIQPTPPMRKFGEAHGFEWPEDEGMSWEEQAWGAPQLTAGAVSNHVVLYHHYCVGLPTGAFGKFLANTGAVAFSHGYYQCPWTVITARGKNLAAAQAVQDHLEALQSYEYPGDAKEAPPWGAECKDSRIDPAADNSARLREFDGEVDYNAAGELRLRLSFENSFAGPLAIEQYLRDSGFEGIELSFEDGFETLDVSLPPIEPKTGLFAKGDSPVSRFLALGIEERWEFILSDGRKPRELAKVISELPISEAVGMGFSTWKRLKKQQANHYAAECIERIGRPAEEWARALWAGSGKNPSWLVVRAVTRAVPFAEAVELGLTRLGERRVSKDFADLICGALDLRVQARAPDREELPSRRRYKELIDSLESKLPHHPHCQESLSRLRGMIDQCPE
jgi:MoaA/NifB/PqqE/SkfB family radical SAM enzyme